MLPIPSENHGIILFDGVCNYCSKWVDLVMKFDKKDYFRFATLQSETAQKFFNQKNISKENIPDSVILIENEKMFFRSDAGLKILRKLGFPFSIFCFFIVIPAVIRDGVYNFIANNRYKWFGKKDVCRTAITENEKKKFIS